MSTIDKRLERLEQSHGDKHAPNYIVVRDRSGGPLTGLDMAVLAAGRVRIKGYIGVSPDDWPPAPGGAE